MNTAIVGVPSPDPLDLKRFGREIEEVQERVFLAAREWGVHSDEPFAAFLASLLMFQRRAGEETLNAVGEMSRIVAKAEMVKEGDALRQRTFQREVAGLHTDLKRVVESAVKGAAEERRSVHDDIVNNLLPVIIKSIDKPLVIRERRHNYMVLMSGALTVAAVVTGVFLVGFSVSLWADWRGSKRLDDLVQAVAYCERYSVTDSKGTRFCRLDTLLPKDREAIRADQGQTSSR